MKGTLGSSWYWVSVARYFSAHCLCFFLSLAVQFVIVALENTVVSRLAINLCDKKEHSVDLLLKRDHLFLRVDGLAGESELSISELEDSLSILESSLHSAKTYVGGLPGESPVLYHGPQTSNSLCWAGSQENCFCSSCENPSLFLLEQALSAMQEHNGSGVALFLNDCVLLRAAGGKNRKRRFCLFNNKNDLIWRIAVKLVIILNLVKSLGTGLEVLAVLH